MRKQTLSFVLLQAWNQILAPSTRGKSWGDTGQTGWTNLFFASLEGFFTQRSRDCPAKEGGHGARGCCWDGSRIMSKAETIQARGSETGWGPAMRSISVSWILLMLNQSKNKYNGVGWKTILCILQLTKTNHPRGYSKAAPEAVWQNPSISEMLIGAELADQGNTMMDEDRRPAADYRFK